MSRGPNDAAKRKYVARPQDWANQREMNQRHEITDRELRQGKLNTVFEITLDVAPATETLLEHPFINTTSEVSYGAKSANAAAALATLWYEIEAGRITFHHASSAQNDRTFGVIVIG